MELKELLPPNLMALGRLVRTRLTLAGWIDRQERKSRMAMVDALAHQSSHSNPPSTRRSALVFSLRGGWYPHAAWEAVLGHALRLRGVAVHMFNCGGPMPICEVNFRHAAPAMACAECGSYAAHLTRAANFDNSWLRDYVSPQERRAIERAVNDVNPADYSTWCFDGQPVG